DVIRLYDSAGTVKFQFNMNAAGRRRTMVAKDFGSGEGIADRGCPRIEDEQIVRVVRIVAERKRRRRGDNPASGVHVELKLDGAGRVIEANDIHRRDVETSLSDATDVELQLGHRRIIRQQLFALQDPSKDARRDERLRVVLTKNQMRPP